MKQATTPTIKLTANVDTDFEYYDEIRINLYDNEDTSINITRDKSDVTINKNTIEFTLTQEETLMFDGKCFIELRVKAGDRVTGFKTASCYFTSTEDKVIM